MTDINICVFGDGFVKGAGDELQGGWFQRLNASVNAEHGPVTFYNLGVTGSTSLQVLARLNELAPRMPAGDDNRLILSFGVEDTVLVDGKQAVSNQDSVEALKSIILKTRGHYKMVMVGLPPVYDPQRNSRIKRLNCHYQELCSKARVPFIDIFTAISEDVQYKRALAKGDKVHPDSVGYKKIFELISNDRSWWFS